MEKEEWKERKEREKDEKREERMEHEETRTNSRKSVTWSAVPYAP